MKRNYPDFESGSDAAKKCKRYFPIASLTPTISCSAIKGTLTQVSSWRTSARQAKFLTFHLKDESGEISGIAFDPMSTDFHDNFKLGATVILQKAKVEFVNADYRIGSEKYKLTVNKYCSVEFEDVQDDRNVPDPDKNVPDPDKNVPDPVDTNGQIVKVLNVKTFRTATGLEVHGRQVIFKDKDGSEILLQIMGKEVLANDIVCSSFIIVKNAKPAEDGTKNLLCEWKDVEIIPLDVELLIKPYYQGSEKSVLTETSGVVVPKTVLCERDEPRQVVFTPIKEIISKGIISSKYNIAGIVVELKTPSEQDTKPGNVLKIKSIVVADQKHSQINMTVWGNEVAKRDIPRYSVVTAQHVTLREHNNNNKEKVLNCHCRNLEINPEIPQAGELKKLITHYQAREKSKESVVAEPSGAVIRKSPSHPFGNLQQNVFTPINEIVSKEMMGSKYDIAVVVVGIEPPTELNKSGKTLNVKVIFVTDNEHSQIKMNVWENRLVKRNIPLYTIITAKNVALKEYDNEMMLTCLCKDITIKPKIPQVAVLKELVKHYQAREQSKKSVVAGPSDVVIPKPSSCQHYNPLEDVFTPIKEILSKGATDSKYHITGVLVGLEPPIERNTRTGSSLTVRTVAVADLTYSQINIEVWGKEVAKSDIPMYSLITAKNVSVKEYNSEKGYSCLWKDVKISARNPKDSEIKRLVKLYQAREESKKLVVAGPSDVVIPKPSSCQHYNPLEDVFTPIKEILSKGATDSKYHITGVVVGSEPPMERNARTGSSLTVTAIIVADLSCSQIHMDVWGNEVAKSGIPMHSVITAKNVKVKQNNNEMKLSCLRKNLQIDPNHPQAAMLKKLAANYKLVEREDPVSTDYTSFDQIKKQVTESSTKRWSVIGFVNKKFPSKHVTSSAGTIFWTTKVKLRDITGDWLIITIWYNESIKPDIPLGSVMVVKEAKVRIFDEEVTLQVFWNNIAIDPDIPAVERLKELREAKTNSRLPTSRMYYDDEYGDYTSIEVIKRWYEPGDLVNTIGLVVEVNEMEERELSGSMMYTRKCLLRDKDRSEIGLNISMNTSREFDIPMHSVIVVRDATLHLSKNKKMFALACGPSNIEFNVKIPETKDFKEAVLNALVQLQNPVVPYPDDFTAIRTIKEITPLGTRLNIIGLVVDVIERENGKSTPELNTAIVTLRDADCELIILNIRKTPKSDNSIQVDSVVAVRDATLRQFNANKELWCLWKAVEVNPEKPQAGGLKRLKEIPFVRGFTPFKTIERETSLIGCKMDIIGLVIEILPRSYVQDCNGEKKFVAEFILRNEVEMKLRIWELENEVPVYTVISAKDALLMSRNMELMFSINSRSITINPEISATDRTARSLCITQIERILEEATAGDKLGVLAVVTQSPRRVMVAAKEQRTSDNELAMEYVKLIDASRKQIIMTISPSIADTLRESSEKTVVVRAWNVLVCKRGENLQLACSRTESTIQVNPQTEDAAKSTLKTTVLTCRCEAFP